MKNSSSDMKFKIWNFGYHSQKRFKVQFSFKVISEESTIFFFGKADNDELKPVKENKSQRL